MLIDPRELPRGLSLRHGRAFDRAFVEWAAPTAPAAWLHGRRGDRVRTVSLPNLPPDPNDWEVARQVLATDGFDPETVEACVLESVGGPDRLMHVASATPTRIGWRTLRFRSVTDRTIWLDATARDCARSRGVLHTAAPVLAPVLRSEVGAT